MKHLVHRLRYYLGLLGLFARYSLMEQMEYRINFAAGVAVECGYMLIKLMYAVLILQAGAEINGLSPNEMLMCIGTYILVTGVYMGVYPNFWALPLSVQDGSLDMLLTKPLNTQFLVTLRRLDFGMPLPDVLCGLALIVYGWQREGLPVPDGGALPRPDRLGAGRTLAGVRPAAADLAAGDAPVHQRQRLSGGRSQFYCGGFCNGYDHGVQHL